MRAGDIHALAPKAPDVEHSGSAKDAAGDAWGSRRDRESSMKWKNGARCVVMLTFDFDAETLWIGRDAANWDRR
jgi:hypothetical protein